MNHSPLQTPALFHVGPVAITEPVIVTWVIMAFLTLFAIAVTRRLSLMPSKAPDHIGTLRRRHRQPDPRYDAGRAWSLPRADRDDLYLYTYRQLVVV